MPNWIAVDGAHSDHLGTDSAISRSSSISHECFEWADGSGSRTGGYRFGASSYGREWTVGIGYPKQAQVIDVITTRDMLQAVADTFPSCDGLIGAAAPCDYEPRHVASQKMSKTGEPMLLELIETPDVVATTACQKKLHQWIVGFALETEDIRFRAIAKMERKCCDMMVSNGPSAIDSESNTVDILARNSQLLDTIQGDKSVVAAGILKWIQKLLIDRQAAD